MNSTDDEMIPWYCQSRNLHAESEDIVSAAAVTGTASSAALCTALSYHEACSAVPLALAVYVRQGLHGRRAKRNLGRRVREHQSPHGDLPPRWPLYCESECSNGRVLFSVWDWIFL